MELRLGVGGLGAITIGMRILKKNKFRIEMKFFGSSQFSLWRSSGIYVDTSFGTGGQRSSWLVFG